MRVINKTFLYRTPSPRRKGIGRFSKQNQLKDCFVFYPRARARSAVPLWVFHRLRMDIYSLFSAPARSPGRDSTKTARRFSCDKALLITCDREAGQERNKRERGGEEKQFSLFLNRIRIAVKLRNGEQ